MRALIDGLFNGDPPYTPEEEKDNRIQVNVNWKEGAMLLLEARQQYENAFLSTGNYFTVSVPNAPASKVTKWNTILTTESNRILKESRPYLHTQRQLFGSVCLHGIGVQMWEDDYAPIPFFVPVEDILVPTDTLITLENLTHFAVRRRMTVGQLFRKTIGKGDNIDPGWKVEKVKDILASFEDLNENRNNWNWYEHPEELAELWKQNQAYYDSDAAPIVKLWDFYYQSEEVQPCWYRVIIQDDDCSPGRVGDTNDPISFVYESKDPYAQDIDRLMQPQFGDGNNKPPFKWYAVRGLGYILFDVVHMMNRLRCQFTQKVFEDLMLLFKVNDPVDRSRLDKIYMGLNYGIVPDGLQFVKREERYEPNAELVQMLMANYKQLMGESTSSYTQDIDEGTNKERTAFEVSALLNQTAKLTGSMLNLAYVQAKFVYREYCRRITCKDSPDFIAKRFMATCREQGVPDRWLDSSRWVVEPERVLGQGNMQLEQAQAKALLDIRPILDPEAQQFVTNKYVFSITHDPRVTEAIAPLDGAPQVTDTMHDTELVFSAFMNGCSVEPKPGLNPIEVVETMLGKITRMVKAIMQGGGVGTPQQAMGLEGAAMYCQAFIDMLSEDVGQKDKVTAYGKALGKAMNEVKAMMQRQAQAAKAAQQGNGGPDPEAIANIQAKAAETQVKLQGKKASDQQKLTHKQQAFEAEQQRKNIAALGDVQRDTMLATVEAQRMAREKDEKAKED